MPRPTTKIDLLNAANSQFDLIWSLIDAMPDGERNATFKFGDSFKQKEAHWKRDRNLRDVLVHLYEWHQLLLNWIASNQNGEATPFLPEPYSWKTYGDMNVMFCEKHQSTSYDDAKAMLMDSHHRVINVIESFSNDEIFMNSQFAWTGKSTLGSYCVPATSSHYNWAIKKIKAHRKTYKE